MPQGIVFPDAFVPVLSGELHREPTEDHNLWQFCQELRALGRKNGDTVRVNAPLFLDEVADPDTDRMVSSLGVKVSSNASQTLDMNKQEVKLRENLLPNALQVREYEEAHSFVEVAQINGAALAVDYFRWRDKYLRTRFLSSTYKSFAGDATSEASIDVNDKYVLGTFTRVAARLAKRFIPRFSNGRYFALIDPAIEATLYENQQFLDATTRALAANAPIFKGQIGPFAGIEFFRNNNIPTKAVGAGGSVAGSQAIMFGASTLGLWPMGTADGIISKEQIKFYGGEAAPGAGGPIVCVTGMPAQARLNDNTDFGRMQEMIWISHEEFTLLDPNPGAGKTVGIDCRFVENIIGATVLS